MNALVGAGVREARCHIAAARQLASRRFRAVVPAQSRITLASFANVTVRSLLNRHRR
jgi:hypothetical protein